VIVTFPPIANALAIASTICTSLGILFATLRMRPPKSR